METIVSINIGSVPDAYSARTIYVSKHVPWKAPFIRCPHKRIVAITKVYIARNTIHVEIQISAFSDI